MDTDFNAKTQSRSAGKPQPKDRIIARQNHGEAGRDPATVGIEARMNAREGDLDEWVRQTEGWRDLGATHISINTMGAGFKSLRDHINAISRYKEALAV